MTSLPALKPIAPGEAKALVASGQAILVDIREPMEHARERIPGTWLIPLSKLDAAALAKQVGKAGVIFLCQSGMRTAANAACLAGACAGEAHALAGGLNAWKAAGLPVAVDKKAPLDLMRQVQISTGGLVVLGAALAAAVSPWFLLLAGFVGAGLVFAGTTGFCGMARLLAKMPWNKVAA